VNDHRARCSAIAASSRAVVFAHYDPGGDVDPHVVHALRQYRRHCDRLVFVSNGGRRTAPRDVAAVVDTYLARPNVGYDFCAWRDGLATLDRDGHDEIICVNDSVYGPLADLGPTLASPLTDGADLWGPVVSVQPARRGGPPLRHVQTWFFAMRRRLLQSEVFERFWSAVEPQADKPAVIDRYEVGLSTAVERAGMAVAGIYDAGRAPSVRLAELLPHVSIREPARSWRVVRKGRRVPHNPSELVWWRLLEAGVPYVKVGLFRINHYGVDLRRVMATLERSGGFDTSLIRGHLARCG
jgi:lipopolysaccharide biosynthesis protein